MTLNPIDVIEQGFLRGTERRLGSIADESPVFEELMRRDLEVSAQDAAIVGVVALESGERDQAIDLLTTALSRFTHLKHLERIALL
ncbi:hypothetical protein [Arthrobacter sp. B1805]|uniref:hypothetical protein n=1 Tax=Arthrobacter sp. B1805 TaxID=2058892 RepID=UPI000CE416C4|nr:hypothetical protein [Arthrobacter sp. B1805]